MEKRKYMCYITYAVPVDKIPDFPMISENNVREFPPLFSEETSGFMPQWFDAGCFPEDEK